MPLPQTVRNLLFRNPLYQNSLRGRSIAELNEMPADPWPGDPQRAHAIRQGTFPLGRTMMEIGGQAWDAPTVGGTELAALHGFSWLRDLRADVSDAAATRARDLVGDWIHRYGRWHDLAWRPDVLGDRLLHWFYGHPFLLAGADAAFSTAFLDSAGAQGRHLARAAGLAPKDHRQFAALGGVLAYGIAVPGQDQCRNRALRLLDQALAEQVLPDGGHVQRDPSVQMQVLARLLEIRALLAGSQTETPAFLQGAIDRMAPFLRTMRLGDGGLARFNGGCEEESAEIDRVLTAAGSRAKAMNNARHSGFQRLQAGRTIMVIDAGGPPPAELDGGAHAGMFSFEMSASKQRLIVNCGSYGNENSRWHKALRNTAAHSSLAVDDTNSTVLPEKGAAVNARPAIQVDRNEADGSILTVMTHDGYHALFDLSHRREVFLAASGADIRGLDTLRGSGGREFTVRFHLHPHVHASLLSDGSAILLRPRRGEGWRFKASGGSLSLRESVYFENDATPRRCEQIIVSGDLYGQGAAIKWGFKQEG